MKKRYWIIAIAALAFVGLGGWWYVTASTNTTTSSQLQKSSKSSSKTSKATPSTKKSKDSSTKNSSAASPAVSVNSKSESKSQAASVVSSQTTSQSSSNSYKPKSVSVSNSQIAMMAYQARGGSEMLKDPNSITYGKDPQGTLFISRNNGESKMIFKIEITPLKCYLLHNQIFSEAILSMISFRDSTKHLVKNSSLITPLPVRTSSKIVYTLKVPYLLGIVQNCLHHIYTVSS